MSAQHTRLRAAIEACPFKSWAAFTDDGGSKPHTNLVSMAGRTECVLALPGHDKHEPLVQFLTAATPKTVENLLAERDALLEAATELSDMYEAVCQNLGGMVIGKSEIARDLKKAHAAISKALGQEPSDGRGE